jgi:putative AdoMet-dependent methyltransferase
MSRADLFPPSNFDPWAETYDHDVVAQNKFPFAGYEQALETVVRTASPESGMSVLDIGTGTGNLAARFLRRGCELWCTDFSRAMLEKARPKLPQAHFVLHDLRAAWPAALDRRFDRIVSAYVFHHFELQTKIRRCIELAIRRLAPYGKLIIADLSFIDASSRDAFGQSIGEL